MTYVGANHQNNRRKHPPRRLSLLRGFFKRLANHDEELNFVNVVNDLLTDEEYKMAEDGTLYDAEGREVVTTADEMAYHQRHDPPGPCPTCGRDDSLLNKAIPPLISLLADFLHDESRRRATYESGTIPRGNLRGNPQYLKDVLTSFTEKTNTAGVDLQGVLNLVEELRTGIILGNSDGDEPPPSPTDEPETVQPRDPLDDPRFQELRQLVDREPSTLTNVRRARVLRSELRKDGHPGAGYGLLLGGSSETKDEEPPPVRGVEDSLQYVSGLYEIVGPVGVLGRADIDRFFAEGIPMDDVAYRGVKYTQWRGGPNHWLPWRQNGTAPAPWNFGKLEVALTSSPIDSLEIDLAGIYASAVSYAGGKVGISEVSSNLRVGLTQIAGNAEVQHSSVAGVRAVSGTMPGTAKIPFAALVGMFASDRKDFAASGLLNGVMPRRDAVTPTTNVTYAPTPLRTDPAAPQTLDVRCCTMGDLISLYSGGLIGPAGWELGDILSGRVAVVPMRTGWLDDPLVNTFWLLAHLEWPWAIDHVRDGIRVYNAATQTWTNTVGNCQTPLHSVHIAGATKALLVFTDFSGAIAANAALSAVFSGNGVAAVNVTTAANSLVGASVDLMAQANSCGVGTPQGDFLWWQVLRRWGEFAGNWFDWETAWMSLLEVHSVKANLRDLYFGPNEVTMVTDTTQGIVTPRPCGRVAVPQPFVGGGGGGGGVRSWKNSATTMSGQTISFTSGDPDPADPTTTVLNMPQVDPLLYLGLAARYVHVRDKLSFEVPTAQQILLSGALCCVRGWALVDHALHRSTVPYVAFFGNVAGVMGNGHLRTRMAVVRRRLTTLLRSAPHGVTAFSLPYAHQTTFQSDPQIDNDSGGMAGPQRVPPTWLPDVRKLPSDGYFISNLPFTYQQFQNGVHTWQLIRPDRGMELVLLTSDTNQFVAAHLSTFSGSQAPNGDTFYAQHMRWSSANSVVGFTPATAVVTWAPSSSEAHHGWSLLQRLRECDSLSAQITYSVVPKDLRYENAVTINYQAAEMFTNRTLKAGTAWLVYGPGNVFESDGFTQDREGINEYFQGMAL